MYGVSSNHLRSPTAPGATADKGKHEFTYSLYPHEGGLDEGGTAAEGYMLNLPIRCIDRLPEQKSFSLVRTDKKNVVVETVKYAEDNDDIIIRAYENSGADVSAVFTLGLDIGRVRVTDLMEHEQADLPHDRNSFCLDLKPFEIKTVRITKR